MHIVSVFVATATIEVRLSGTMSPAEVDAYMDELRGAIVRHRLGSGYGIIVDVTSCTIQTQEMIRTMGERMVTMPRARAIAIVATSQLARLQIRRLFTQDYARIVSSIEEGRTWVAEIAGSVGLNPSGRSGHAAA